MLVFAGCVLIIGVWASGKVVTVTVATELAIVATLFSPAAALFVFVMTQ
jgi:hypothetical protein